MTTKPSATSVGTAVAPSRLGPPKAGAGEVGAVLATIAALADGNCANRGDVRLVGGDACTRAVHVQLRLRLTWAWTSKRYLGKRAVKASQHCGSAADVQAYLDQVCGTSCQDPAISRRVEGLLGESGVAALERYKDDCDLGTLPYRAHHYESCDNCRGRGLVRCYNPGCNDGKVGCVHCGHTGQAECSGCRGSGSVVDARGEHHTCPRCQGRRRHGMCGFCLGSGLSTCTSCNGAAEVGCVVCGSTGQHTRVYDTCLNGRVSHFLAFDNDAPDGFRKSCQAIQPIGALANTVGSLAQAETASEAGSASLTLHCQVRHVQADMTCGLERIHVDALGACQSVPLMPPFLDGLTCELVDDIQTAAKSDPAAALRLALKARLTSEMLALVGGGRKPVPETVSRRWSGAASTTHVELVAMSLRQAYARAGRSPVRRTWLVMFPVIVVGTVLANAYGETVWLLQGVVARIPYPSAFVQVAAITAAEIMTVLPLVLLAWLLASLAGRRRLRTGLGGLARRGPPQGAWPIAGMLVAVAVGWMAVAARLDAAAIGLPLAPMSRPGGRSLSGAFGLLLGSQAAPPSTRSAVPVPGRDPGTASKTGHPVRP